MSIVILLFFKKISIFSRNTVIPSFQIFDVSSFHRFRRKEPETVHASLQYHESLCRSQKSQHGDQTCRSGRLDDLGIGIRRDDKGTSRHSRLPHLLHGQYYTRADQQCAPGVAVCCRLIYFCEFIPFISDFPDGKPGVPP